MTKNNYDRATEIHKQIKDIKELRDLCPLPYKKFTLIKSFLWMGNYNNRTMSICDDGLTEVIREYCDKRIKELQDELEAL